MSAKDILLKPIDSKTANELVKRIHYSGKVASNSQIHIGVYYQGKLEGAMQFGPSLDKRKMLGLVSGTLWNEFIELNRMAFSDALPRNSESRAIGIAMRILKKHCPQLKWVVSFADGCQCGDGTIYRASGFALTGIKKNKTMLLWNGNIIADKTLNNSNYKVLGYSAGKAKREGATPLDGFQLRYIYFIDPTAKERLTVPILPFSAIEKAGAGMYKGIKRASVVEAERQSIQTGNDGIKSDPDAPDLGN